MFRLVSMSSNILFEAFGRNLKTPAPAPAPGPQPGFGVPCPHVLVLHVRSVLTDYRAREQGLADCRGADNF